jgi:uncharacterized membrane protein YhhN
MLLIPFLLLFFLLNYKGSKGSFYILPIIALLGSFAGDVLLAFDGAQYFLWGMLGFMVTHICNSIYFYSMHPLQFNKSKIALPALLLLSITCSIVILIIKDNAGSFLIPIIIYMILIAFMAILASNLTGSPIYNHVSIQFFIPGAILFILSDGLLAINKFNVQDASLDVFVMLTYGLAQLFLVMGYYKVKSKNSKFKSKR